MEIIKLKKTLIKYDCEKCDFHTSNKNDFARHCKTIKHNGNNGNKMEIKKLNCICGKNYQSNSGLWKHQKRCSKIHEKDSENPLTLTQMFLKVVEENKELRELLVQQNEKLIEIAHQPRTTNIKTQNNFNVLQYLNQDCKDAINLSDMIETLQFNFKDLMYLGENGFVKSVEDTFVKQLKDMEQTKRPIHCTDKKRKKVYVKDDNKWERDNEHNKLKKAIQHINVKQIQSLSRHNKANPDWTKEDTNQEAQQQMIMNVCAYNENTKENLNIKLVNAITQNTLLSK